MTRREKVAEIIARLRKAFPEPVTALHHGNPFELLVATVLSAQTTDAHVNKVTASLFRKYPTVGDYARRPLEELRADLSSINFYRNKAKNIQASAQLVLERFNGEVPRSMDDLVTLPGVARKTANIVLWEAFGINEGIAVDTHVRRLAGRLGLSRHEDPVKIEGDLIKVTPRDEWGNLSHYLIFHGRTVCPARKPRHEACVLFDLCPSRKT